MSWGDAMRLRRRADYVRATSWINAGAAGLIALAFQDAWLVLIAWAGSVMGFCYAVAHAIERRAERVLKR